MIRAGGRVIIRAKDTDLSLGRSGQFGKRRVAETRANRVAAQRGAMTAALQQAYASLTPVGVALFIVFSVAILGALITIALNLHKYAGFRDIGSDVKDVASELGGSVFRDASDLVVSGNLGALPSVIRFSHKESVPGMNVRVGVPANFTLWIAARTADASEGRIALRANDPALDTRFAIRTDHAAQARLFLGMPAVTAALTQLACSSNTYVAISQGWLEMSELEIPQRTTARHVLEHLEAISALEKALKQMPGADTVVVRSLPKERHVLGRSAIAVGMIAAVLLVIAAAKPKAARSNLSAFVPPQPAGVLPSDARVITNLDGWRAATTDDFNPNTAGWLRSQGVEASGRVRGDFSGTGSSDDVAYVLIGPKGEHRVVLLIQGNDRYDTQYPGIAAAARVPKDKVAHIDWLGSAPTDYEGDGLLLVRNADDVASGLILFVAGHRVVSGVPANYQQVALE